MQTAEALAPSRSKTASVLETVDSQIRLRPGERAFILRRLRELSPGLYQQWLIRTAERGM
ncbi:MAG: hypothetical protein WA840_11735 [Caulobacteraceae bacterium]